MKKKILYAILILLIIGLGLAAYGYSIISTGFDINKTVYVYIDKSKNYDLLLKELKDSARIKSSSNFDRLADLMEYKGKLRTGRYAVSPNMNILDLIRNLRNGQQEPVKLKFNNIRTKEDFSERISQQLMLDEKDLFSAINNESTCAKLGFTTDNIVAMFIPNTYEFYWDIELDSFLKRMKQEYAKFWDKERMVKAEAIEMTPIEVSTLASIVEEECMYTDEYPKVAGLYINRLKRGQLLQADPTVKFAVGDFSLRRILFKHTETESPYNTYIHTGLPPGPIRIPSIKGIDAVLNYAKHDYLYMCAKDDFSGYHNFAVTHGEHLQNRDKYIRALNARGIK
ncbi:MAG: endolytic transglycosylase MltG [Dysgonomonas sp.]|nr:endolytic transglycosylase MltG [Dysgonomonas sp.]